MTTQRDSAPATWLALAEFLAVSMGAGVVGMLLGRPMPDDWYLALDKPAFNPPSWLFGPVWTLLYLLMGTAAWLVWRRRDAPLRPAAMGLFSAQLVLNAAWSGIFFGLHEIGWALAELLALWALVVATTWAFWRIRRPAGLLLLPYLAWLSFAGVLNFALWRMN